MRDPNPQTNRHFKLDDFPSGAIVTDSEQLIIFVNDYVSHELHWDKSQLLGKKIETILTKGAKVFYHSYLLPMLLHEKRCSEIQLSIINGNNIRTPITVNARVAANNYVYWSFFTATSRNKLYDELISAREKLEQQTQALKKLASVDELTGLLNRREIKFRAMSALSQLTHDDDPIAMIMIDIDYFKDINDNYGHPEGDRILKQLGQVLINSGRKRDLIARYGGEEFLILLPNTALQQAMAYAERLHQAINSIVIAQQPLTVSMGVTLLDNESSFDKADTALYRAKELGRNRTEVHSQSS
ncbi:GGDEF domain-containing protein [Pseudoalteromonas sp.]|uniref:GGDEF domain-containing protein n=1 Tax=Pseudoalteromonas sp. TaxID=53249 RepID=UPI0035681D6A